jgi:ribonuclease HI
MEVFNIQIRWFLGHTGIVGNEEANRLADLEAKSSSSSIRHACYLTASGIRSAAKRLLNLARQNWWDARKPKLSTWYC